MVDSPFTVLTVCVGNVNRSPLAAVLLESWAGWYLPPHITREVKITSAGLGAPIGLPMGRRTRAIADALGADGSAHRAQQITEGLVRAADLVLVSSARQREDVMGLVPASLRTIFTIREAGRIAAALPGRPAIDTIADLRATVSALADSRTLATGEDSDDIIDPEGMHDDAYLKMAQQEVPPLAQIAAALFGMPPSEVAAYVEAAADPVRIGGRGSAGAGRAEGRHRA